MKPQSFFHWKRLMWILGTVLLFLAMVSCSSQSNQPNPATPEGRFELAKREFAAARFDKALNYLDKLLRDTPNHELAPSAAVMEMAIYGGLAEGCRQVGKVFADGRMMTRDVRIKNDFRNTAFDYYRRQKAYLLNFAELYDDFSKRMDRSKMVSFQGLYPQIEAGPRIFFEKVKKGLPIAEEDRLKDAEEELRNGVLTMVTALTGSGEDRPKARTLLAAGTVTVDPGDFLFAVAKMLHQQDVLFDRMQLNELQNFKAFCERTNKTITESLDLLKAKGDQKKIDAALKVKKDCDAVMKQFKKT